MRFNAMANAERIKSVRGNRILISMNSNNRILPLADNRYPDRHLTSSMPIGIAKRISLFELTTRQGSCLYDIDHRYMCYLATGFNQKISVFSLTKRIANQLTECLAGQVGTQSNCAAYQRFLINLVHENEEIISTFFT